MHRPLGRHTGELTVSRLLFPARLRNGVKYCKVLRLPEVSGAAPRHLSLLGPLHADMWQCTGRRLSPALIRELLSLRGLWRRYCLGRET